MASENEVITMESSCHHMTKCTSLKLPHSKRWIQQITIISNYWIRLSYDLKNYADLGGNYQLRRITYESRIQYLFYYSFENQITSGSAVVKALVSHQCGPGLVPRIDAICGLSLLLGLSFAPRGFSLGTFLNSNSTTNLVDKEPLCGWATFKTLLYLKEAKTC